jgi:hypothetical protein
MLNIDRLRLYLPQGFRDRAPFIARMVAQELAMLQFNVSLDLDRLNLPPVSIPKGAGDQQIARAIAESVQRQIMGKGQR